MAKNSAGRGSGEYPLPQSIRSGTQNGKPDSPALEIKNGQLNGKKGSSAVRQVSRRWERQLCRGRLPPTLILGSTKEHSIYEAGAQKIDCIMSQLLQILRLSAPQ